jgi:probable F420-dependent oxidoreductase
VSLGLPVDRVDAGSELVSGRAIADLAVAYERAGFHAAYVTDHPAPDERWLAAGGHHALEPTVALAVAAGATRRLALHTNVYVLAYRNPFLAAKALASLDVVSDGRLILGVAAGYLAGEFAALGVEHAERVELLERSLTELRRIWSGATVDVDGAPIRPEPLPVQRPTPPIWIGGNTVAAMRRAARHGDGWSPFPTAPGVARATGTARITDVDDLRAALGRCTEVWEAAGREETPTICFVPFGLQRYLDDATGRLDELVDEITELSALGVDWVALSVPGRTRAEVRDRAGELADRLGLRAEIGSA